MRISTIRRFHAAAVAACLAIALPLQAQAQDYPSRPVRLIVPYPVGGASDITARLVADKLSKKWGQGVIVENKAGANGIIGTAEIAKAAPDGYTIGLVASSHVGNPFSYKNVPFDTLNDLQPVTQTATVQLGLVVNPKLGVNNVQELVALLKQQPGKIDYATTGPGGNPHLFAEVFMQLTGTQMTQIPYKGSSSAHPDLLSGQVSVMFDAVAAVAPHVKAGKLKLLGVSGATRASLLPDVPTLQEAGVKGYAMASWGGIIAPAKVPRPVIQKLNADIVAALNEPDVRERLTQLGADVVASTPEQFDALLRSDTVRYQKLIKDAGIVPQ
ncbi:MAG: tripartite tricarboxylate transporter substrate binding protein [Burkholderiaceae bacterium]|nr:tripartite tricarboxylate transporter substrate binding protein [Rhodoferax sp.]MCB2030582.1 tripartite tricarboxylate transporter substrate binding protein [Rhodoferax sp.]MCB2043284.1 tripartite tricarboxylate transporter substrate binding protein [Rhodoferax sp.]MCP5261516.1 tripartite tricarboxylate transporter substrate binding protein [Rhodoferax sp.]